MGILYLGIVLTFNTGRTLKTELFIGIFMFSHTFESFQAFSLNAACVYVFVSHHFLQRWLDLCALAIFCFSF